MGVYSSIEGVRLDEAGLDQSAVSPGLPDPACPSPRRSATARHLGGVALHPAARQRRRDRRPGAACATSATCGGGTGCCCPRTPPSARCTTGSRTTCRPSRRSCACRPGGCRPAEAASAPWRRPSGGCARIAVVHEILSRDTDRRGRLQRHPPVAGPHGRGPGPRRPAGADHLPRARPGELPAVGRHAAGGGPHRAAAERGRARLAGRSGEALVDGRRRGRTVAGRRRAAPHRRRAAGHGPRQRGRPARRLLDRRPSSLGLSIVRDLVGTQMGGTIAMRSDGGTVVELVIPVDHAGDGPRDSETWRHRAGGVSALAGANDARSGRVVQADLGESRRPRRAGLERQRLRRRWRCRASQALRSLRRSSSEVPPQMPDSWLVARANSRQDCWASHCRAHRLGRSICSIAGPGAADRERTGRDRCPGTRPDLASRRRPTRYCGSR